MNSPLVVSSVSTVEDVIKGKVLCGNKHVRNTRNLNFVTMQLQVGIEQRLDKWKTEIASFRTGNLPVAVHVHPSPCILRSRVQ